MRCDDSELEKKIECILDEMDLSEISKEPISKSFDSFWGYVRGKLSDDSIIKNIKKEELMGELIDFLNGYKRSPEYKRGQFEYNRGMHHRIHEWTNIAEEKFSKLLNEETGMRQEDISIIRKPFHILAAKTALLHEYPEVSGEFGFDFLIKYKGTKLSIKKFCNRLRSNKCVDLSALYDLSIEDLIRITGMGVVISSDEVINKRFLEEIFIPFRKKQEGYVNEEDMRQDFEKLVELDENFCKFNVSAGKKILARNLIDIDNIYSKIRKKYSSLREYITDDLGIGAKPFF
mgnify:CR=1 FL=1